MSQPPTAENEKALQDLVMLSLATAVAERVPAK